MEPEDHIINRVAASPLITFDLEEYYSPGERVLIDIAGQLYQGLVLREKDFREFVKQHDWSSYTGKLVAVTCSADAIVPTWAYMLVGLALQPFARCVVYGSLQDLETELFRSKLHSVNWSQYQDAKVVVKGCSKVDVPVTIYVETANQLRPFVSSLMFGEPCSTVPLFKKNRNAALPGKF